MFKPDYTGNSIVNLMGSVMAACGAQPRNLPLRDHDTSAWAGARRLALIVVDGLGWDILHSYGADTLFAKYATRRLTSVFPSTTAAAITMFTSGLSPAQHALTGGFVWLKELGTASVILPFAPRWAWTTYNKHGIAESEVYNFPNLYGAIPRVCRVVSPASYVGSAFSNHTCAGAEYYAYRTMTGFARQLKRALCEPDESAFVYAYWPGYDSTSHHYGVGSEQAAEHLHALDKALAGVFERLAGTGTRVLITADHGFIDTKPETRLALTDFPDIAACLNIPLCGESRVPYAYVKPELAGRFEELVRTQLGHCCMLNTRREMLEGEWYGLGEPNPRLADRIGDYILHMRDGWVLMDQVLGERRPNLIGFHGGSSETEMHVPLIELMV